MNTKQTLHKKRYLPGTFRTMLLLVALIMTSLSASASHFRFGLITATRISETGVPNAGTVTYHIDVQESWRHVAAPGSSQYVISGGNSGAFTIFMSTVTDPSGGWDNSTGSANITLNKTSTPTKIEFTSCCKISTLVNNSDQNWDEYIILNTNAPGSSPVSSMPAIVNLQIGQAAATFAIPASDPDAGSTLTWGTPSLTGPLAGQSQPPGFTVNSTTGVASMNTSGATNGQLYNAMVTVTDNNGNTIEMDFIIKMVIAANNPPVFDYAVTPANNTVYNIQVGQPLSFNIKATDADAGSTVGINAAGLNAFITAANFSPALPNTASGQTTVGFSYTPGITAAGSSTVLNFSATDNNGAQAFSSVTINVLACPTITETVTPADPLCNAGSTGSISVLASGSTAAYSYSIDNGATYQSSNSFTGLPAGTYAVKVMDANACASATQSVTLTDPALLSASTTQTDVLCHGSATGAIDLTVTGGTGTYSYAWDNAATTEDLSGLAAGTYNVTVTDANGCTATAGTTILEPTQLVAGSISATPQYMVDNCHAYTIYRGYGPSSITLSVSPSGGTPGYSYAWTPAASAATPAASSTAVSPIVTTTYTVNITDANNCPASASFTVNVIDVRCGNAMNKVKVHHHTSSGYQNICISPDAVPAHIAEHNDCLGDGSIANTRTTAPASNLNMEEGSVSVFPNPATGTINVALKETGSAYQSYQITDINGRVVASRQFKGDVHADMISVDISNYAKGMYILRAVTEEGASVAKFTVK